GGLLPGLRALLTEIERVRRHGFTPAELERAKVDHLRGLVRGFKRGLVDSKRRAEEIQDLFLDQRAVPAEAFKLGPGRQLLAGIELGEVNRLAATWTSEANRLVVIKAPARPEVPVPTEAQLREVLAAVRGGEVEAWEDRTQEGPLMPRPPQPGKVV